jgi:hypothetical protein
LVINFVYKLLIKGLVKTKQHFTRRALPITPDILLEMVMFLDLYDPSDCVFWCIFLFAFFLMSRKSNLVPDSVRTKTGESSGAGITLHMRIYALTGQRRVNRLVLE